MLVDEVHLARQNIQEQPQGNRNKEKIEGGEGGRRRREEDREDGHSRAFRVSTSTRRSIVMYQIPIREYDRAFGTDQSSDVRRQSSDISHQSSIVYQSFSVKERRVVGLQQAL